MNWQSISPILRIGLLLGAVCYLALILWLLKKKKLTVRYSIIWLLSAGVLLVFAVFPYVVLVLTDLLGMAVPVNVVFLLVIAFILLLLLSLSSIVSVSYTHLDVYKRQSLGFTSRYRTPRSGFSNTSFRLSS